MNAMHPTHQTPTDDSVGYGRPPKTRQWKRGHSGNPAGRTQSIDLKAIIQEANTKKRTVKSADGKDTKVPVGDIILERLFIGAAKGDVRAQKLLIKYAKQYLPSPDDLEATHHLHKLRLKQEDYNRWKAFDCLPPNCPDSLDQMTLAQVKKAHKAELKKTAQLKATPEGEAEYGAILDKLYGPPNKDDLIER